MVKFVASVALVALCIGASVYGMKAMGWLESIPSFLIEILGLLSLATLFIFYRLNKIPHGHADQFIKAYLTSIVLKLLAGSALVLAIILADRVSAFANAALFMTTYLVFTVLEVGFLWAQKNRNGVE